MINIRNIFNNLSIAKKFFFGFGLIFVFFIFSIIHFFYILHEIDLSEKKENEINMVVNIINHLNFVVLENMVLVAGYNDIYDYPALNVINKNRKKILNDIEKLREALIFQNMSSEMDHFESFLEKREILRNQVINLVNQKSDFKKIDMLRHQREALDNASLTYLNKIKKIKQNELNQMVQFNVSMRMRLQREFFIMVVVVLLMMVSISHVISYSITSSIRSIFDMVKKIIDGDFTVKVKVNGKDELGVLAEFLNILAEKLEKTHRLMTNITNDLQLKLSEEKKAEVLLEEQATEMESIAYYDCLTGLPNRILFEKKFSDLSNDLKRDKKRAALVLFDIENFKNINETLGHKLGDTLLKEVANRIIALKNPDDIAARFFGDMFVILLLNVQNINQVEKCMSLLYTIFDQNFQLNGYSISASANAGVVLFPDMGEKVDVLIRNADLALHYARRLEKRWVIFNDELEEERRRLFFIEIKLREAILKKQFYLVYQPIINSDNRSLFGVEVLLRWQPLLFSANLTNNDIIPIAEKLNLILELGRAVIEMALLQYVVWTKKYRQKIKMTINLSTKQIIQKNFIDWVSNLFSELNVDPAQIVFEITETAIVKDAVITADNLMMLRKMGCGIWIDDFGTGYASLKLIENLPVTAIKIDKSFVQAGESGLKNVGLIKSIFMIADSIGLEVISEGIETEEQFHFMKTFSSNQKMQGFLFSKGLVASEVEKFFDK